MPFTAYTRLAQQSYTYTYTTYTRQGPTRAGGSLYRPPRVSRAHSIRQSCPAQRPLAALETEASPGRIYPTPKRNTTYREGTQHMITSKQLLDLIKDGGPTTPGFAGKVEALRRFGIASKPAGGGGGTVAQRQLFSDLAGVEQVGRPARYAPPAEDAKVTALTGPLPPGQLSKGNDLSGADLAWLQRLPSDPSKVTYADAVQLAALSLASSNFADRSGARLVESIWAPVRELHDARAAEVALRNAQQPEWTPPASLCDALADALHAEHPELTEDEAYTRGRRMLSDAQALLDASRDATIANAQAAIVKASDATAARTSVVKATT